MGNDGLAYLEKLCDNVGVVWSLVDYRARSIG